MRSRRTAWASSVSVIDGAHRPVVLKIGTLEFDLTAAEAITLADSLVDAVEQRRDELTI